MLLTSWRHFMWKSIDFQRTRSCAAQSQCVTERTIYMATRPHMMLHGVGVTRPYATESRFAIGVFIFPSVRGARKIER